MQINYDELCRQKGECVTQMEILQGKLQMINTQLQQYLNAQQTAPVPQAK